MIIENNCPLCKSESDFYTKDKIRSFYRCNNCKSVFSDRNTLLLSNDEKNRYEMHNNDIFDVRYKDFVSPITNSILNDFDKNHIWLDFWAWPWPIISKVLEDNNYNISKYDPYFWNNENLLSKKYDYIACCEVIEHFYNPDIEFEKLKNMLKKDWKLFLMTHIYDETIDFKSWYYKNDITHVFFYTKESLEYIKQKYDFSSLQIKDRLIVFEN